jgi:hypothetical protein
MGRLTAIQSGAGGAVQNFTHDHQGNLLNRIDLGNSWTEDYTCPTFPHRVGTVGPP